MSYWDMFLEKKIIFVFFSLKVVDMVVRTNVLKTGPVTEPEKLPVHGSLIRPVVKLWLNR